jgi:hypothetical protein
MKITRLEILVALGIAALIAVAAYAGVPRALGAHPWWAAQTGMIGAALGFAVFVIARLLGLAPGWVAALAALVLLAAFASAYFGKSAFVNAEAFNAAAGRVWYFSWIALTASAGVLAAGLFATLSPRNP